MKSSLPSFEEVQKARENFSDLAYKHWIHDDLFTWKWYLLLFLSLFPWIIWWLFVDKKRLNEIILFGTLLAIPTNVLDNIGTDFNVVGIYCCLFYEVISSLFQFFLFHDLVINFNSFL